MITKEYIEEIKRKNGNNNFTLKEMILYIIEKNEKQDEALEKLNNKLTCVIEKKIDKKTFHWITGILFTAIFLLIGYLITLK